MPTNPQTPSNRPADPPLRIGTRGSALARWQAEWVAARLDELDIATELVLIKTQGDGTTTPITSGSGQGLFTKEIQRALLDDRIDLAVHSLKDLPTVEVEELVLAAVPAREDPRDALVANACDSLEQLPPDARVGTGSRRRQSQLLHLRPDVQVAEIRGNVDTRLAKLDEGQYDAILLAAAGLRRLGLTDRVRQWIAPEVMLPAVGQGALGLETRRDDQWTRSALAALDHSETHAAVIAERALLAALRAGCLAPVGAWARVESDELHLNAVVLSPDGARRIAAASSQPLRQAAQLGANVAQQLIGQGAAELIAQSRDG